MALPSSRLCNEDEALSIQAMSADELGSVPMEATQEMLRKRKEALAALRALGELKDVIPDPVARQREQREDCPLPRRE
jgi:hypothetical protein